MYYFFGERIVFLFQEKKVTSAHPNVSFSPVHCLVPMPHYCAWPMLFGSRGPRKLLAVSRPFISDTSPECIDREGLERHRTGTRQARLHASVFDSRSPSTEFYVIDLTRNLFCSPLPFWELLGHPPCIFNPSSSKLSLGHFLDTNSVIYNKLSSFNSFFLFKQLWWQQWQADAFYMQHKTQYAISEFALSLFQSEANSLRTADVFPVVASLLPKNNDSFSRRVRLAAKTEKTGCSCRLHG